MGMDGGRRICADAGPRGVMRRLTLVGTRGITSSLRTRKMRLGGAVIVKTSAVIMHSRRVLNGPGGRSRTCRVLLDLRKETRRICANITVLSCGGTNRGRVVGRTMRAGIRIRRVDRRRVHTCVTAKSPVSGTKTCKVRKDFTTCVSKVRKSCCGMIKLPMSCICRRLGGHWACVIAFMVV